MFDVFFFKNGCQVAVHSIHGLIDSVIIIEILCYYPCSFGARSFNGVADFITYKRNLPSLQFNDSVRIVSFKGVSVPTAYTGRDVPALADYPDYRQTLYWHPALELVPGEILRLDCAVPDYAGTFEVVVEGIDDAGNPLKAVSRFEVR